MADEQNVDEELGSDALNVLINEDIGSAGDASYEYYDILNVPERYPTKYQLFNVTDVLLRFTTLVLTNERYSGADHEELRINARHGLKIISEFLSIFINPRHHKEYLYWIESQEATTISVEQRRTPLYWGVTHPTMFRRWRIDTGNLADMFYSMLLGGANHAEDLLFPGTDLTQPPRDIADYRVKAQECYSAVEGTFGVFANELFQNKVLQLISVIGARVLTEADGVVTYRAFLQEQNNAWSIKIQRFRNIRNKSHRKICSFWALHLRSFDWYVERRDMSSS